AGMTFGRSLEYRAYSNDEVKQALKKGNEVAGRAKALQGEHDSEIAKREESKKAILLIGAGSKERFNWNELSKYVSETLPRPDGSRLSRKTRGRINAYEKFYRSDPNKLSNAQKAYQAWLAQGALKDPKAPKEADEATEEFIRKHLVQVHVE